MMQSDGAAAGGLPPSTATTANAAAGPSVTDRAKAQMEQVSSRVQDATANPILPVVFRAWIWLFSLLSWTITASCSFTGNSDAVNFQLAVGLIIWLASFFWLGIEIAILKDKSLPFQTGSKILNRIEIYFDATVAFLAFGAACSVAGITSSICTNKYFNLNRTPDCDKLLSSNVFMCESAIPLTSLSLPPSLSLSLSHAHTLTSWFAQRID